MCNLLDNITIFLGSGASLDAGCKTSPKMLEDLRESINILEDINKKEAFQEIHQFILASLQFQNTKKNILSKEISYQLNIEDFVLALRKIINRENILPYPFVGNWSNYITKYEINNENIFKDFLGYIEGLNRTKWLDHDVKNVELLLDPLNQYLKTDNTFKINIFTINYDLVFESFFNSGGSTIVNNGFTNSKWCNNFDEPKIESKINYYKIHGSLDWQIDDDWNTICDSKHEVQQAPHIIFGREYKMVSIDPFLSLIFRFKESLERTKYYIIIGYSFFDTYINNLILKSLNEDNSKKIIIIDPEYSDYEEKRHNEIFSEKLKFIQNNPFAQEFNNITKISTNKINILPIKAIEFYKEYFSSNAKKLLELLNNLEEKDRADDIF